MFGVVDQRNNKDDRHQEQRRDAQRFAKLIQPALQGCLFRFHILQHGGDEAELGVHAGAGDHAASAPVGDHRAHKGCVLAIAQRDIFIEHSRGVLLHRERFAGERGLLHPQVDRFQQAHIRGNKIACFEKNRSPGTSS